MSLAPAYASTAAYAGNAFISAPRNSSSSRTSHWFGIRISALVEMVIFFSALLLWDALFGNGDRFMEVLPHPFWIVVLLVILQYGIAEAIAAALLASALLLAGNMPLQSLNETMYDYAMRVGLLPVLWMSAALVLGGIRARQLQERQMLCDRLETAEHEKLKLADSYRAVKESKEKLELRLVEECRSVAMVYDAAQTFEAATPSDRLEAASRLVRVALNPRKFSLYRLEHGAFILETAHGWENPGAHKARFDADSPLARAMVTKQSLSIIHAKDEDILDGEGLLAGPILDPKTGKIFGMLKIEDIGFMDMGIRTHKTFHVVCEWLARTHAVEHALAVAPHGKIRSITGARTRRKLSVEDRAHAAL